MGGSLARIGAGAPRTIGGLVGVVARLGAVAVAAGSIGCLAYDMDFVVTAEGETTGSRTEGADVRVDPIDIDAEGDAGSGGEAHVSALQSDGSDASSTLGEDTGIGSDGTGSSSGDTTEAGEESEMQDSTQTTDSDATDDGTTGGGSENDELSGSTGDSSGDASDLSTETTPESEVTEGTDSSETMESTGSSDAAGTDDTTETSDDAESTGDDAQCVRQICHEMNPGIPVNDSLWMRSFEFGYRIALGGGDRRVVGAEVFTGESGGTSVLTIHDDGAERPGRWRSEHRWAMQWANGWQGGDFDESVDVAAGRAFWLVWLPVPGSQGPAAISGRVVPHYETVVGAGNWVRGRQQVRWRVRVWCCDPPE